MVAVCAGLLGALAGGALGYRFGGQRYRARLAELAVRSLQIPGLQEERNACLAELAEREAREGRLEREVEALRAQVASGVNS